MRLLTAGSLVRVQLEEPEETGVAAAAHPVAAKLVSKAFYGPLAQLVRATGS